MDTELIAYHTWDNFARKLYRRNMKARHSSLTAHSIATIPGAIKEIREDTRTMIVVADWRERMQAKADS